MFAIGVMNVVNKINTSLIYVGYVTLFDVCVRDIARISVFFEKNLFKRSVCIWDSSVLCTAVVAPQEKFTTDLLKRKRVCVTTKT